MNALVELKIFVETLKLSEHERQELRKKIVAVQNQLEKIQYTASQRSPGACMIQRGSIVDCGYDDF